VNISQNLKNKHLIAIFFSLIICGGILTYPNIEGFSPWIGFVPVATALILILLTNQAWIGLFMGSVVGVLFLSNGDLFTAFKDFWVKYLFPTFDSPWRIGAILFTLILGSFARVLEKSGGFEYILQKLLSTGRGDLRRKVEGSALLLGLICFFDGLANSLLVGRLISPIANRSKVSAAKLSYIVDSTSSSVACVAFISTWIATQLSLIEQSIAEKGIESSAYSLFFKSIPFNFYCLFTILMVFLVVWRSWDVGPMKKAQSSIPTDGQTKKNTQLHLSQGSLKTLILPLFVLVSSIFTFFYLWETKEIWPITAEKISSSFGGDAGPYVLVLSSLLGLATAVFVFPKKLRPEIPHAIRTGAADMLGPLTILVLAWCFGSVLKEMGTAVFLADMISGKVPPSLFPAAVFLIGAMISFSTGSSWGTMGLLMPIALPAFLDLPGFNPELIPAVIAAVFSGAVFGDHCSPFSDTTIVSAFSCGIDAKEHVLTQLPYASICAILSITIGFGSLYFFNTPIIGLVGGLIIMLGITSIKREPARPEK